MRVNGMTEASAKATVARAAVGGAEARNAHAVLADASDKITLSIEAKAIRSGGSQTEARNYEHMTPTEMKSAAEALCRSGQIDLTQLFMLQNAGVPCGKQGPNGEFVPLSDAERQRFQSMPIDYVQVSKDALRFLEKMHMESDPKSGYAQWRGILAVLQS